MLVFISAFKVWATLTLLKQMGSMRKVLLLEIPKTPFYIRPNHSIQSYVLNVQRLWEAVRTL